MLRSTAPIALLFLSAGCAVVPGDLPPATDTGAESPAEAVVVPPAAPAAGGATLAFEVAFVTHLDMDMPEQDVFIERVAGSGEVYRVTKGDNDMSAVLYRTAVETPHDPFDPDAIGPHPRGEPLGFTLGEWLAHRGTGTYEFADGVGTLDLEFSGLVPNGVYTMWHAFAALPPTDPFSGTLDLPLGARDGSESIFVADAAGEARFTHAFRPGLQMTEDWTTSMLAIAYHSDGKTWGGSPGRFGLDSHVPLFAILPRRADASGAEEPLAPGGGR